MLAFQPQRNDDGKARRVVIIGSPNVNEGFKLVKHTEKVLLTSLDAALRDLDSGKGTSIGAARKLVGKWAGK